MSVEESPTQHRLDLAAAGMLPPLATAFLAGRDTDLLQPLRYLAAGELPAGEPPPVDRRELAAALATTNRAYGHPGAGELAAALARPETRVVVTGQQPGLFGGPLYTLVKAAAAGRWAEAMERAGQPAVAVFWVATEDHDWDEAATATVLAGDGPLSVDLGPDPEPLAPLGARPFGESLPAVLERLEALPGGPGYAGWWRELGRWYRPGARFGEAFFRLMVRLLGPRCPLLLDAQLTQLKAAQRPLMRRLVEERREVDEAYAAADAAVTERGYPLQVAPQPGFSPLFLLDGGRRRRIEWRGEDRWTLRGGDGSEAGVDELLHLIDDNPLAVSPGVLARPAIQDAVLGTSLQVMGGGELSYLAQAAAVYPLLGVAPPWTTLRPHTLVLEERQLARLEETGLSLGELVGDAEELDRRLAAGAGGELTGPVKERLAGELEALKAAAVAIDANLERPWEKTRDHMLRALDTFTGKVTAAAARADEVRRRRVDELRRACLPGGKPQERLVSSAHFPGRYGDAFTDALWEGIDLDPRWLKVVAV